MKARQTVFGSEEEAAAAAVLHVQVGVAGGVPAGAAVVAVGVMDVVAVVEGSLVVACVVEEGSR